MSTNHRVEELMGEYLSLNSQLITPLGPQPFAGLGKHKRHTTRMAFLYRRLIEILGEYETNRLMIETMSAMDLLTGSKPHIGTPTGRDLIRGRKAHFVILDDIL